ncbi:MAG: flagellin [Bacteroidota bacterium]
MSFRIATNTNAAFSLSSLNKTSNEIGMRQMRLSTGSRINAAGDDSAGFTIANKLRATSRGQAQALSNIGDAKSMLAVAEGARGSTMDILQTMKEKAVQAGNSSMGTEERAAIQSQVDALAAEVGDILGGVDFNGTALFSDSEATSFSFQVGDASGDTFGTSIAQIGVSTLGLGTVATADADSTAAVSNVTDDDASSGTFAAAIADQTTYTGASRSASFTVESDGGSGLQLNDGTNTYAIDGSGEAVVDGVTIALTDQAAGDSFDVAFGAAVSEGDVTGGLDLTDDTGVASALTTIDSAISSVNRSASSLGDVQNRLDFKAQNLETSMNNYDAARSRIEDADFAKEQMEIVKLQILQQTGSAMFAQANAAPQSVLSFF